MNNTNKIRHDLVKVLHGTFMNYDQIEIKTNFRSVTIKIHGTVNIEKEVNKLTKNSFFFNVDHVVNLYSINYNFYPHLCL